jgi:redox-sensitive bicupin YhaK (pirin superfamily)
MSTEISRPFASEKRGNGTFSTQSIDLGDRLDQASPVVVLDDFRVSGRPFGPHPHAGFSAVTYVFEDSPGALRSRDSLGNDIVMGPGGIVWTQAGSGVIHEEVPADAARELHGLQVFVNLSAKNKLIEPRTLKLEKCEVPEWRGDGTDRVRVVVGSFQGLSSPLIPVEPFHLLDVALRNEIVFDLSRGHNAVVHVLEGEVRVRVDGRAQNVAARQAVVLSGNGGTVKFEAVRSAHFLVLSGAAIREPTLVHGPFIMNEPSQIHAAMERFRAGKMGHLEPLAET